MKLNFSNVKPRKKLTATKEIPSEHAFQFFLKNPKSSLMLMVSPVNNEYLIHPRSGDRKTFYVWVDFFSEVRDHQMKFISKNNENGEKTVYIFNVGLAKRSLVSSKGIIRFKCFTKNASKGYFQVGVGQIRSIYLEMNSYEAELKDGVYNIAFGKRYESNKCKTITYDPTLLSNKEKMKRQEYEQRNREMGEIIHEVEEEEEKISDNSNSSNDNSLPSKKRYREFSGDGTNSASRQIELANLRLLCTDLVYSTMKRKFAHHPDFEQFKYVVTIQELKNN